MARMKDVAERCGVSESTVSHVINGTRFVSPEVRENILRAMRELNYHGNAHARRLARGSSDFLGLIISDIENPFFPGLIKAFETAALAAGHHVLLSTTNYDPERTATSFRMMIENKTPAVAVMTSRVDPAMASLLEENRIASVFLDSGTTSLIRSNVRLNYARGANEAVNYLTNLGHRNFAFISGPQTRPSHAAWRDAVLAALQNADANFQVVEGTNSVEGGDLAVQQLLTAPRLPTAILCSNDLTALGALRGVLHAGLRVPEDISIIGADDIPFAELAYPALSTVRIPREKLGQLALDTLLRMMRNKEPGAEFILDTELVIRNSTGRAQSSGDETSSSRSRKKRVRQA